MGSSSSSLPMMVINKELYGSWFVKGKPLVLHQWTIDSKCEKDKLLTIPIWVKFPNLPLRLWSPTLMSRLASTLGKPLYMDEATATGSRVDYARVCTEIEASFQFPRYTHSEVDGIQEEIAVHYDWEPKPCTACASFGHEHGSCVTMATTLATMEITTPNTTLPTESLVGEEKVGNPVPPPSPVSALPEASQKRTLGLSYPHIQELRGHHCRSQSIHPSA